MQIFITRKNIKYRKVFTQLSSCYIQQSLDLDLSPSIHIQDVYWYIYHFWSICLCCGKNTIRSGQITILHQPRYPWNKRFPLQFTTIWWPKTRVFGRDEIWPDSVNTTNKNNSLTQLLPCLAYLLTMVWPIKLFRIVLSKWSSSDAASLSCVTNPAGFFGSAKTGSQKALRICGL